MFVISEERTSVNFVLRATQQAVKFKTTAVPAVTLSLAEILGDGNTKYHKQSE